MSQLRLYEFIVDGPNKYPTNTKNVTSTTSGSKNGMDVNIIAGALPVASSVKLTDGTDTVSITDVGGKKSLDVNVTAISIDASGDSIETRKMPMSQLIDQVSSSVTYVCEAAVGVASSAASWRCKKITVTGTVTRIQWAGSAAFNQIADNRASLTYV